MGANSRLNENFCEMKKILNLHIIFNFLKEYMKLILKSIFYFCLTLYSFQSFAQSEFLFYEGVIQVDSTIKKNELFINGRKWISDNFKDSKEVITIQDKETGELSGNGAIKFDCHNRKGWFTTSGYVTFKLNIQVKDGKYKYYFFDFEHHGTQGRNGPPVNLGKLNYSDSYPNSAPPIGYGYSKKWVNEVWVELKFQVQQKMENLLQSLENYMNSKNTNEW